MALYCGTYKCNINLDGIKYCLNLYSKMPITNGIKLLSSDGYVLKDISGLYLTVIESNTTTSAELGIATLGMMQLGG